MYEHEYVVYGPTLHGFGRLDLIGGIRTLHGFGRLDLIGGIRPLHDFDRLLAIISGIRTLHGFGWFFDIKTDPVTIFGVKVEVVLQL